MTRVISAGVIVLGGVVSWVFSGGVRDAEYIGSDRM